MDITITSAGLTPSLALDDLAPGPAAVDAEASDRFSQAMDAPEAAGQPVESPAVEGVSPAAPRTMGDNILNGLQNLSTELQQTWKSVGAALNGDGRALSMQDLLSMQMGLSTMSVQYELVGKAVSRSTQNIDQLVKLQ